MRVAVIACLVLMPLSACGDDAEPKPDTSPDTASPGDSSDTAEPDSAAPDTADDTTAADTAADVGDDAVSCEHPCLNEFGKNDKSLCPVPQSEWVCTEGCCVPVFKCQVDADCATRGFEEGQCDDERFACHCNAGTGACFTWHCAVHDDCADGEICAGGACVVAPDTSGLAVRILDRQTVLAPGATYQLHAEAFDPDDSRIVVAVAPTWTSSDDDVAAVDASGLVTAGTQAGLVTITAAHGDERASIVLENVVPAAASEITLVVRTELTWEPVVGRYAVIGPEGTTAEDLPLDGIVRIPTSGNAGDTYDVHIMGEDNDWVSWLDLAPGTQLYLPIPKTVYGKVDMDQAGTFTDLTTLRNVGIISGTPDFTTYSYEGTLEIVLTTTGLSSALFDFSLPVLLGSDVKRFMHPDAQIPRVDPTEPITIPGGIVFNLLGPAIPSYVLTAPLGHHRLWSIGGKLNLNDVAEYSGVIFDAVGGGDLDFTKIVGAVFPLFRNFWSGYANDIEVPTVGDPSASVSFTQRLTTPMGFSTRLDVPLLPAIGELGFADGLFLLSGAQTVDGFMVPLGLSGGADTSDKANNPPDGLADGDEKTPQKDPFPLPAAPLHAGLQGPLTRYLVAAVAASIPAGSSDPRPSAGSATLARWAPGERPPEAFTLAPFLGFPSLAQMATDFAARVITPAEAAGTELLRVLLKGKRGAHWTFYGVQAGVPLAVPNPADFGVEEDRFVQGELESVLVNCMDFAAGIDLGELARPGGLALDLLLGIVERVSFIDIKNAAPAAP